jgi:hypothetical protein
MPVKAKKISLRSLRMVVNDLVGEKKALRVIEKERVRGRK